PPENRRHLQQRGGDITLPDGQVGLIARTEEIPAGTVLLGQRLEVAGLGPVLHVRVPLLCTAAGLLSRALPPLLLPLPVRDAAGGLGRQVDPGDRPEAEPPSRTDERVAPIVLS